MTRRIRSASEIASSSLSLSASSLRADTSHNRLEYAFGQHRFTKRLFVTNGAKGQHALASAAEFLTGQYWHVHTFVF